MSAVKSSCSDACLPNDRAYLVHTINTAPRPVLLIQFRIAATECLCNFVTNMLEMFKCLCNMFVVCVCVCVRVWRGECLCKCECEQTGFVYLCTVGVLGWQLSSVWVQ